MCDGRAKLTELPAFGETKIVTHQGKVKRIKFDEGGRLLRTAYRKFQKQIDRIILRYKAKKIFNKVFLIGIVLIILFGYPILSKILIKNEQGYSLAIFFYVSIFSYFIYFLSSFYFRNLNSSNGNNDITLQNWIESIKDNNPIFDNLILKKPTDSIIENLVVIKKEIMSYCEDDEEKLRLLRSYYFTLLNNNRLHYWYTIIGFITLLTGYLINSVINKKIVIVFLDATLPPYGVILLALSLIVCIYNDLTININKTMLVHKIIDELIEQKEKEVKK